MRRPILLFLLVVIGLTACDKKDTQGAPAPGSPEDAVRHSLGRLRDGEFELFWKESLPPADFAALRADWPRRHDTQDPVAPEDQAKFAAAMKRLTAPDAEKALFSDLRPTLLRFDRDARDQMPLIAAIGQSMALTAIDRAAGFTPSQKKQLREAANIVGPWTQTVSWGNQAHAKAAIGMLADTARKAHVSTLDDLDTMGFEQSMATWSTAWLGFKRVLDVYGLSIDESFESVRLDTLENTGASARIKITYALLGKPIQTDATLVLLDGRWYDSDLLQRVRDEHRQLSPPAPAESVPAPPSTVVSPPSHAGTSLADARDR